ncbi:hypothetical protein BZA05DRAFT_173756 [Tricharina praecox]|uniref:uncharacterized protein n=1 Tax=Tricharina praecox TaxID=43433 RepID=UPI00221F18F8|nr:uncharacterized protein BZA05DRAFT_173756 [Tricharina praecox]KAI5844308.1 hypothetical protein BZA05DRAFT_173756 [Tricharina praecox]
MTTKTDPTLKSVSGHWFTAFPIPEVAAVPQTYQFTDRTLSAQVFTHPSFANGTGPHNAILSFEGATLITTLATLNLTVLFPATPVSTLSDLRLAITSRALHAHLSRALSLPSHLRAASADTASTERAQSELFEAYIAGVFRELTAARFDELRAYHLQLLQPYIVAYHALHRSAAHHPVIREKQRKQEMATYTVRLMEYAAKNRLEPPVFEFTSNGAQGPLVQWGCQVILGGVHVAKAVAGSKSNAKHLASAEAFKALPVLVGEKDPPHTTTERRKKKEFYRAAAKTRATPALFGQPGWAPSNAAHMATAPSWGS